MRAGKAGHQPDQLPQQHHAGARRGQGQHRGFRPSSHSSPGDHHHSDPRDHGAQEHARGRPHQRGHQQSHGDQGTGPDPRDRRRRPQQCRDGAQRSQGRRHGSRLGQQAADPEAGRQQVEQHHGGERLHPRAAEPAHHQRGERTGQHPEEQRRQGHAPLVEHRDERRRDQRIPGTGVENAVVALRERVGVGAVAVLAVRPALDHGLAAPADGARRQYLGLGSAHAGELRRLLRVPVRVGVGALARRVPPQRPQGARQRRGHGEQNQRVAHAHTAHPQPPSMPVRTPQTPPAARPVLLLTKRTLIDTRRSLARY